jgi:hypothetical protein
MTTEQFTYWLQGFMEVANPSVLDEKQTQIIKDHLALVFDKQTPDRSKLIDPYPLPTSPFTPIWETDPNIFRPICETPIQTETDPMKVRFCNSSEIFTSHIVPQDMFGKKQEDTVGTNSFLIGEGDPSPKDVVKAAMKKVARDVRLPTVVREGKIGKGGLEC